MARSLLQIGVFITASTLAAIAEAGTLTPTGNVLLNCGRGFEVVHQTTACDPTDQVLVKQGTAHIIYTDGSRADLAPGLLYVVGRSRKERDDRGAIVLNGGQGGHGSIGSAASTGSGAAATGSGAAAGGIGGISTTGLVVGGLVAAGGIGLLVSGGSKPSSP